MHTLISTKVLLNQNLKMCYLIVKIDGISCKKPKACIST